MGKGGRPTLYNRELALQFCDELAKGKLVIQILKEHPEWPRASTWYRWEEENAEFRDMYARARRWQVLELVEKSIEISQDTSRDFQSDGKGGIKSDNTATQRDRLQIDTIKWYAAKIHSKLFGDKIQQEVTGADGAPFQPVLNITVKK